MDNFSKLNHPPPLPKSKNDTAPKYSLNTPPLPLSPPPVDYIRVDFTLPSNVTNSLLQTFATTSGLDPFDHQQFYDNIASIVDEQGLDSTLILKSNWTQSLSHGVLKKKL